ncbi:bifunctional oligoribonuclease/PAP phosphatase NrnA, partial [Staphylococcus pseudintermedius]|uniref:DHH family phosphoesterase n=1 Tax=Staphylococcus pseudintermedius TaxID=283734 RepID=UPI000E3B0A66
KIASALYLGIVCDTGSFFFNNTSPTSMTIASQLFQYDIHHNRLLNQLREKDQRLMPFHGYVLHNFQLFEACFCQVQITHDLLEQFAIQPTDATSYGTAF